MKNEPIFLLIGLLIGGLIGYFVKDYQNNQQNQINIKTNPIPIPPFKIEGNGWNVESK